MTTDARAAVLHQLESAYETLAVKEQLARTTDPGLAEDYHRLAVAVLRARMAEDGDPAVPELGVHCLNCAAAYAAGDR